MSTGTRLARIEGAIAAKVASTKRGRFDRVFSIVIAKGDEEAGYEMARSHGWTDADGEFLIVRSVVTPAHQEPYSKPPYMLHMPQEARP